MVVARRLLDAGANPNAADQEGKTALHYGSGASVSAMELLLVRGVKLDMRSRSGHTALDEAITYGNEVVLGREDSCQVHETRLIGAGVRYTGVDEF